MIPGSHSFTEEGNTSGLCAPSVPFPQAPMTYATQVLESLTHYRRNSPLIEGDGGDELKPRSCQRSGEPRMQSLESIFIHDPPQSRGLRGIQCTRCQSSDCTKRDAMSRHFAPPIRNNDWSFSPSRDIGVIFHVSGCWCSSFTDTFTLRFRICLPL